jgi:hypothetical protein
MAEGNIEAERDGQVHIPENPLDPVMWKDLEFLTSPEAGIETRGLLGFW